MHILLTNATRRPYKEVPAMPEGAIYNHSDGFWSIDNKPLVSSSHSSFAIRMSKKCDQETGEDQKGE